MKRRATSKKSALTAQREKLLSEVLVFLSREQVKKLDRKCFTEQMKRIFGHMSDSFIHRAFDKQIDNEQPSFVFTEIVDSLESSFFNENDLKWCLLQVADENGLVKREDLRVAVKKKKKRKRKKKKEKRKASSL